MYSPKLREDVLIMLNDIKQVSKKPMTILVDELLRPHVTEMYEQVAFKEPYTVQLNLFEVRESHPNEKVTISSPRDVWELCSDMRTLVQERLDVLCLDTKNGVTHRETVFLGSLNMSVMHPREVFALAIEHRAASIIVVHNHPSGDMTPSREDIAATQNLKQAGDIIDVPVLDHVIIGDNFASLKEDGHL